MKILIKTPITKDYHEVFALFNRELFIALKPPVVNLVVERFDGCKKGDEVHLNINGQRWVSHITEFYESDDEIYFIDIGVIIPPPLSNWKHIHRIVRTGQGSCEVIDDIEFTTGNTFLDKIIYPAFYTMFLLRRPIYKKKLS